MSHPAAQPVRIYVASPLGFDDAGRAYYRGTLIPALHTAGFDVLDPWPVGPPQPWPDSIEEQRALNHAIGQRNERMLEDCAAVLAVLDGVDVDSGTAAEIGYARARAKPVVGLRTDLRHSGDNDAAVVNLQVEHFIVASGGVIAGSLDDAVLALVQLALADG